MSSPSKAVGQVVRANKRLGRFAPECEGLERRQFLSAGPTDIRDALDLPVSATPTYSGDAQAVTTGIKFDVGALVGFPSGRDADFLMLSTGIAAQVDGTENTDGSQGTDLGDNGADGDAANISFSIPVPASTLPQKLKFDFVFMSEEYPEFVTSSFNDTFSATVNGTEVAVDQAGHSVNVNSVLFTVAPAGAGTYFDGRTERLTATYNVPEGETSLNVVFSISDVGDGIYDSAVVLDNVRFEQRTVVWLNFDGQDVGAHLGLRSTTFFPPFQISDLNFPGAGGETRAGVIGEIVDTVKALFANYDIDFTTTRPDAGEYSTVVIGGNNDVKMSFSAINPLNAIRIFKLGTSTPTYRDYRRVFEKQPGNLLGRAQSIGGDVGNLVKNDLAVIFSGEHNDPIDPVLNLKHLAGTIAHELGHNLGLRHLEIGVIDDLMQPTGPVPPTAIFTNKLQELLKKDYPDGSTQQNADAYLRSILGSKIGGSSITPSIGFEKFGSTFLAGLSKPIYDVDFGLDGADAALSTDGGDDGQEIFHLDVLMPGQSIKLPFAPKGTKFFLMGASKPGGPIDIVTGKASKGNLGDDAIFVPLYADDGTPLKSFPLSKGQQPGKFTSFGKISLTPSPFTSTTVLPKGKGKFVDVDGDTYTITLSGPGSVAVILEDSNGTGSAVKQILLQGTNPKKSGLTVSVKKAKSGDGLVSIARIDGTGLAKLSAPAADLTGSGVNLSAALGKLTVHDILNSAGVSSAAGADAKATTLVTARNIGDGSVFNIGTTISKFSARSIGQASLTAPSVKSLIVADVCSADLTTGILGSVKIGRLADAQWTLHGDATSITLGQMINSTIYAGVQDGTTGLPTTLDAFVELRTIKKFTITGAKSDPVGFANSFIAASVIGTVKISKIVPDNTGTAFGLCADQLKSIQLRGATQTVLRWNDKQDPALLLPQGDLIVTLL